MTCQRCKKQSVSAIRKVSLQNGYIARLCINCTLTLLNELTRKIPLQDFKQTLKENQFPTIINHHD